MYEIPSTPNTEQHMTSYNVILHYRAHVESSLLALAKRAARKNLPMPTWTWGKPYTEKEHKPGTAFQTHEVTRIPLHLDAPPARYGGWTFAASLQHTENGTIVRCVPGTQIPEEFRNAASTCEHCKVNRRRNDTFVLQHDSARYMQVGSSCIADFLGGEDASRIAAQAELYASCQAVCMDGTDASFGGPRNPAFVLSTFLAASAAAIRTFGWSSRSSGDMPTADRVLKKFTGMIDKDHEKFEVTEDDTALAAEAEAWAESLTDEYLSQQNGDYLHNVRVIARGGSVDSRSAGIAASIVQAYNRNVMQMRRAEAFAAAAAASEHVGTLGKREAFNVKLSGITGFETAFGYTTLLTFVTDDGAIIVWKASTDPKLKASEVGERFRLTGTVKDHTVYRGAKQTLVQRCKLEQA